MKTLIYVFKKMWKFITQDPKDRTDEEWEEYFAIAKSLKRSRELSERRNRIYMRSPYTSMYKSRNKRRYRR